MSCRVILPARLLCQSKGRLKNTFIFKACAKRRKVEVKRMKEGRTGKTARWEGARVQN